MHHSGTPGQFRRIAVLVSEGCALSGLHVFLDIMRNSGRLVAERRAGIRDFGDADSITSNLLGLQTVVVGPTMAKVRGDGGTTILPEQDLANPEHFRLVYLPPLARPPEITEIRDIVAYLLEQRHGGALLAAAGNSVFTLAATGLLDGHAARVPHTHHAVFARRFPAVQIERGRIPTENDGLYTADSLFAEASLACHLAKKLSARWVGAAIEREVFANGPFNAPDMSPAAVAPQQDSLMDDILRYLAVHYSEPLVTADLARNFAISERTLHRRFGNALNRTPHAYVRELRMDAATRMLLNTDLTPERIAERVGYGDCAFFARLFRRKTGLSPRAFRAARNDVAIDSQAMA